MELVWETVKIKLPELKDQITVIMQDVKNTK